MLWDCEIGICFSNLLNECITWDVIGIISESFSGYLQFMWGKIKSANIKLWMLEMVLWIGECPKSFILELSLDSIVYNPVISWNLETSLVWSDFLCQGIWPVYQYLGKFLECPFFSLPSPYCYISLSDFFSSFKFQFPHCLFCRLPHWNYSFLQIVHSILLLFLLASSFVLFSWISVYVLPMSDGWGRAWCLLQVYLIYIKTDNRGFPPIVCATADELMLLGPWDWWTPERLWGILHFRYSFINKKNPC